MQVIKAAQALLGDAPVGLASLYAGERSSTLWGGTMRVLGIDPGGSGALALYQPQFSPESGMRWIVEDMPEPKAFRDFLRKWSPDAVYFEDTFHVRASTHGSYKLGRSVGEQLGVLYCLDMPVTFVHPATWKAYFRLRGKGKEGSLEIARIYVKAPYTDLLKRKMDHNRAEAILIASFGAFKLL